MVGAVGDDDAGRAYLVRLERRGIDVSRVPVVPGQPTGQAWITVSDTGREHDRRRPRAPTRTWTACDLGWRPRGDVLLAQLEVPLALVAPAASRAHAPVPAWSSTPHRMPPCRPTLRRVADPVVVNEHEPRPARRLRPRACRRCWSPSGGAGATGTARSLRRHPVPERRARRHGRRGRRVLRRAGGRPRRRGRPQGRRSRRPTGAGAAAVQLVRGPARRRIVSRPPIAAGAHWTMATRMRQVILRAATPPTSASTRSASGFGPAPSA